MMDSKLKNHGGVSRVDFFTFLEHPFFLSLHNCFLFSYNDENKVKLVKPIGLLEAAIPT
jgi:hypothetical protein